MKQLITYILFLLPAWLMGQFTEEYLVVDHYSVGDYQIADFDVDGDLDIVALTFSGTHYLNWFENLDGKGNFSEAKPIEYNNNILGGNVTPQKIFLSDINANGIPEVLVTPFSFLEMDSQGVFQSILPYPDSLSREVQFVDLDSDGDQDLLFTYPFPFEGASISINQDGQGDFSSPVTVFSSYGYIEIGTIDFDADNDKDVLLFQPQSAEKNKIYLLKNEGSFADAELVDSIIVTSPNIEFRDFIIDDFNQDGLDDLATLEKGQQLNPAQIILRLNGNNGFDSTYIYTSPEDIVRIRSEDIDEDGDPDIIPLQSGNDESVWVENKLTQNSIEFISRDFNGGLWLGYDLKMWNPQLADLNGDNLKDLVCGTLNNMKGLYWQERVDNQLVFGPYQQITNHLETETDHLISDIDHDGDQDILSFSSFDHSTVWFENLDGYGSFSKEQTLLVHEKPILKGYSHDVSGDSLSDLLVIQHVYFPLSLSTDSEILFYKRDSSGLSFEPPVFLSLGDNNELEVDFGDIDGDGYTDICTSDDNHDLVWFKNLGNGNSFEKTIIRDDHTTGIKFLAVRDFDKDGFNDILVGDFFEIWYFRNTDGLGDFSLQQKLSLGLTPSSQNLIQQMQIGDVDNDGDLDIAIQFLFQGFGLYKFNQSTGEFDEYEQLIETLNIHEQFRFVDLDNNGDLDIIFDNGWMYNTDGEGSYSLVLGINGSGNSNRDIEVGDFDGDGDIDFSSQNTYYIKWFENEFDSIGSIITGRIYKDENENCILDNLQDTIYLSDWLVELEGENQNLFVKTNNDGYYTTISQDTGEHTLTFHLPNPYWEGCFNDSLINVPTIQENYQIDFPAIAFIECPIMEVDIANSLFRPCIDGTISVHYTNTGTAMADDAYVEVLIDSLLTVTGSSEPWSMQTDSSLIFEIGDLPINASGIIRIDVLPVCDPDIVGELACNEAMIFPDTLCIPTGSMWDESSIEITGFCDGDSITYIIKNVGMGDMDEPRIFEIETIINDDIVLLSELDTFQLDSGECKIITVLAQGAAMVMEAEQDPEHPVAKNPTEVVINCTLIGLPSPSIPFLIPANAGVPTIATACRVITGSYDPNFKEAFPIGIGGSHLIEGDEELQYIIHFQNTGTDTAFNIVIRDTLSNNLDLATLRTGAASHPFSWQLNADQELAFTFDNILLPDSTINEPASHGYVQYFIQPKEDLLPGTVINNQAGIYFDINDPIYTNTVFHTIKRPVEYSVEHFQLCTGETLAGNIISNDTLLRDTFVFAQYDSVVFYYVDALPVFQNQSDTAIAIGQVFLGQIILNDTVLVDTLTAMNGCDSLIEWQISVFTNTELHPSTILLKLFPNPSEGDVFMEIGHIPSLGVVWTLRDVYGREVAQHFLGRNTQREKIDLSFLDNGIYWYELNLEGRGVANGKLILQKKHN